MRKLSSIDQKHPLDSRIHCGQLSSIPDYVHPQVRQEECAGTIYEGATFSICRVGKVLVKCLL